MYTQSSPVDTLNIVKAALPATAMRAELQHQCMQEQHTTCNLINVSTELAPYICNTPTFNPINVPFFAKLGHMSCFDSKPAHVMWAVLTVSC